eukprot:scaffold287_cov337-Pavlova_lutheri.AAC.62
MDVSTAATGGRCGVGKGGPWSPASTQGERDAARIEEHGMDRLKKKYAKLFQAAEEHVKEWNVERSIVEALVNNVANLLARLPVLQQKKLFEGYETWPEMQEKTLNRQLEALERAMARLLQTMDELAKYARALRKTARHAKQLLRSELDGRKRSKLRGTAVPMGDGPSVDECIDDLEKIASMYEDETSLKKLLVGEIHYETTEQDMGTIARVIADDPLVDKACVTSIFERAKFLVEVQGLE